MLKRQRVMLWMIHKAGGTASRMQLTKWAFLVSQETVVGKSDAFYRFVPYHYGPFSFCLYQEVDALLRDGCLAEPDESSWCLLDDGVTEAKALDTATKNEVAKILTWYGRKQINDLMSDIYGRYQWFTLNSKADKRVERPIVPTAVYTAGYERLMIDSFLNGLLRNGIRRVIDVRNNPVSRRYGFYGKTLERLCADVSIGYCHFPQLGIASEQRQDLRTLSDREALFDQYERTVLRSRSAAIREVSALMQREASVIVCLEADPRRCHRSRLAERVAKVAGLKVQHLELSE